MRAVSKNTYTLTAGDVSWIYCHLTVSPGRLIRGLVRRRFVDSGIRFRTTKDLALACRGFVETNRSLFEKRAEDKVACDAFLAAERMGAKKVIEAFSALCRGYTPQHVAVAKAGLNHDRRRYLTRIRRVIARAIGLQKRAHRMGSQTRVAEYETQLSVLRRLERRVIDAFNGDATELARLKVIHRLGHDRTWSQGFLLMTSSEDYLGVESSLELHHPDLVSFPLRFMARHIVAGSYIRLLQRWRAGASRDELLLEMEDNDKAEGTGLEETLLDLSRWLQSVLREDRQAAIRELNECYQRGYYLAAALVGVTQTEGVIWDFAEHLNRRHLLVFKRDGQNLRPYTWNHALGRYERTRAPRWDKKQRLTSARQLLRKTRVGAVISGELYSYLIHEFYDERNPMAHGRLKANRLDAFAAILCLYAVMTDVKRFMTGAKDGGNWLWA